MCGRYVAPDAAALERAFHLGRANWRGWVAKFNLAPTATVPMVYAPDGAAPMGELARWGLIPSWWKKPAPPTLTFNARSEEAAEKPTWRDSLRNTRCLMPAAGWYEWNEREPVRSVSGRTVNQPYFIHCPSEPVVAIAGLWNLWQAPSGASMLTCALLTKAAAPSVSGIHDRMPVVLQAAAQAAWLAPGTAPDEVARLIAGSRHDFQGYAVSTRVNNTRNDAPDLVERLQAPA